MKNDSDSQDFVSSTSKDISGEKAIHG